MEVSDQDGVLLQSFRSTEHLLWNTGDGSDPQQEQRDDSESGTQPESSQDTPGTRSSLSQQDLIESRLKQLNSRRFILLQTQQFRKKAEENHERTTERTTTEDSDKLCELEAIEKELEELLVKKERLEKQNKSSSLSNGHEDLLRLASKSETPRGGIYLLPPFELTQRDTMLEQRVKPRPAEHTPSGLVVPDSLGSTAAVTQCPCCQEVVVTETSSTVGQAMWMLCCLFSMIGGVAGCCLIPFFMKRLRDVRHHCPKCQEHIHTYEPF